MITAIFTAVAAINALMLISLLIILFLKAKEDSEIDSFRLDRYLKELTGSLFWGIVILLIACSFLIL